MTQMLSNHEVEYVRENSERLEVRIIEQSTSTCHWFDMASGHFGINAPRKLEDLMYEPTFRHGEKQGFNEVSYKLQLKEDAETPRS